ncbi:MULTISPECIES: hypothetical protein [unclassified Methylobacterium]|uniref:hypothetical protein n=1 Tax=unclassified Methylobacterium TaxID=2615210 RepID=UPI0006F2DFA8|nr:MULTISPECIES: hypothetical protein [unclassified Methylobacterium]KQP80525.1 hypothetical protein ASF57_16705 [Methylobacterium sp. Leaf117]KQP87279.1 hypothetical protein ASF60_20875 [Methylobacterium sp. Leaf113]MCK2055707.1 hypothetical protein [Methylobacterium sp. 37f]
MVVSILLALVSIPFAAIVLRTADFNRDVFAILYVSSLGLVLSAILLVGGYYLLPLPPIVADPVHR